MLKMDNLQIDEEFDGLLPELSTEERLELQKSIDRDGFRDPIIVWMNHSVIVDGHNRYRIWKQFHEHDPSKTPEINEKKFADRDAVKEWMLRNQLARRNLTDANRIEIVLKLKPFLEKKAAANKSASGGDKKSGKSVSPILAKPIDPVDVRKELAETAGVSQETFRKAEAVIESGNEELKAKMLAPKSAPKDKKLTINAAFNELKGDASPKADSPSPKRWEQGASSMPDVRDHAPEDDDPPAVFTLKQDWRRASKKDRKTFLKWAGENL